MLFRTVYGPELKVIYQFIQTSAEPLTRNQIVTAFIPLLHQGEVVISPQNVEDAISFLISSYLIEEHDGMFTGVNTVIPFHLALLHNLRSVELGVLDPKHPLDTQFIALISTLFMFPDALYADNLHARANSLDEIKKLGGISKEKIQAWKRVMQYLGLGYRIKRGFLCAITPALLLEIIATMPNNTATLQSFFEHTLMQFLPCLNRIGDVSHAVRHPMLYLAETGHIKLSTLQDSPQKAYFQPDNLRQIMREHMNAIA